MTTQVATEQTSPKTWALIVWGLYLASYFTFLITYIIGVIIAYVKRGDLAGTPFQSHMTSAINLFWNTLFWTIIGVIATLFYGVGFLILLIVAIWQLYVTIRGLIKAIDGKPV